MLLATVSGIFTTSLNVQALVIQPRCDLLKTQANNIYIINGAKNDRHIDAVWSIFENMTINDKKSKGDKIANDYGAAVMITIA
ncbi:MAG: hypothetical protein ACTS85_03980 [Arsenophonus sp. NC-PG7-MAG3]